MLTFYKKKLIFLDCQMPDGTFKPERRDFPGGPESAFQCRGTRVRSLVRKTKIPYAVVVVLIAQSSLSHVRHFETLWTAAC